MYIYKRMTVLYKRILPQMGISVIKSHFMQNILFYIQKCGSRKIKVICPIFSQMPYWVHIRSTRFSNQLE